MYSIVRSDFFPCKEYSQWRNDFLAYTNKCYVSTTRSLQWSFSSGLKTQRAKVIHNIRIIWIIFQNFNHLPNMPYFCIIFPSQNYSVLKVEPVILSISVTSEGCTLPLLFHIFLMLRSDLYRVRSSFWLQPVEDEADTLIRATNTICRVLLIFESYH